MDRILQNPKAEPDFDEEYFILKLLSRDFKRVRFFVISALYSISVVVFRKNPDVYLNKRMEYLFPCNFLAPVWCWLSKLCGMVIGAQNTFTDDLTQFLINDLKPHGTLGEQGTQAQIKTIQVPLPQSN